MTKTALLAPHIAVGIFAIIELVAGFIGTSPEYVSLLAAAGAAGAFLRAISIPVASPLRRVRQGVAGAFSAIFLGGFAAHLLDAATGTGGFAYMACGFLCGEGGPVTIKAAQSLLQRMGDKE